MNGARTLILNGLAQNDLDMNFHRLINLDTSNLPPTGIPPTVHPPVNQWLHDWNAITQQWTSTQPRFTDLSGNLTSAQMLAITEVGTILFGVWQASPIDQHYLPALNKIREPLGNVSMGGYRLTGVGDPVNDGDAVNKGFMDLLLEGLNPKAPVRCATTSRIVLSTLLLPVDGVTLAAGDRVLVKNQGTGLAAAENGIYLASTSTWSRATDADSAGELNRAYVPVMEGTVNGGTSWFQKDVIVNFGTDPIEFVLFSGSQQIVAGAGLQKVGNTLSAVGTANRITVGAGIDIANNYIGQNSITTLGTVTTGTWHGSVVSPVYGGTGVANSYTITLAGNLSTVLDFAAPPGSPVSFTIGGATSVALPVTGILATREQPETFTNKRITKRSDSILSNSKPAINTDALDNFSITQLSEAILSMSDNLTGTPAQGQELCIWIRDNGLARSITWGTKFGQSSDLLLPTSTTAGEWLFLWFTWNSTMAQFILTQKLNHIL